MAMSRSPRPETFRKIAAMAVIAASVSATSVGQAASFRANQHDKEMRLIHARELLGSVYPRSIVRFGESVPEMKLFVYDWMHKKLKGKWKSHYRSVARAVMNEARKYEFDPVLIM